MALNIRIDIENRYDRILLDKDFRKSTFESILVDGSIVKLGIKISTEPDKEHKGMYLGSDGSNTARAYLYHRCIQKNYDYLKSIFNIYGVKFYVRVLQDGSISDDPEDLFLIPDSILPGERISGHNLYNYFIFTANEFAV